MPETLVIALGGHAITLPGEPGTIPQQFAHTASTLVHLLPLLRSDAHIAITHGNGPQIGNILIRVEEGERRVPGLPLDTCVSDSQGGMGYMIQRIACGLFKREGIDRTAVTVITQVLVDADPAAGHPVKPIGDVYSADEIERIRDEHPRWSVAEIAPGKWRRTVTSPRPLQILEEAAIARLLDSGTMVIACGGGGIPVAWDKPHHLVGVEGVIDKDFASALLARNLHAQKLIIVTSVDRAAIRYGKPDEQRLATVTARQAREYLDAGEFPAGSMGPKIEAAIDFVTHGGEECIITSTEHVAPAVRGEAGTHIVP